MLRILAGALVAVLAAVGCEGGFEGAFQTSTPVVVVVTPLQHRRLPRHPSQSLRPHR